MKAKHLMPEVKEACPNLTPLIDIIMCLVVFYMLVAHIGVDDGAKKDLHVPSSNYGKGLADPGNTFTLNVENGEKVENCPPIVSAKVPGEPGLTKLDCVPDGSLIKQLKLFYQAHGDNSKVVIIGDQSLKYQFLSPVLIQIAQASIKDVYFETQKGAVENIPQQPGGAQ
jgi:biopolymer transport protein ExbD